MKVLSDPSQVTVFNLSNYHLNKNEISLLQLGLQFTPTPRPNLQQLSVDISQFCRKLRLLEYFSDM